jgi:putative drug exporter of the RND superfamily
MSLSTSQPAAPAAPDTRRRRPPRDGVVVRMARWSARNRIKTLAAWLVFVAAAFVLGGATGTRVLTDAESGVGESGRADRVVEAAGFPARPTEQVLIRPSTGALDRVAAQRVAAELRRDLGALPEVARVGALTPSADGRAAIVPVVIDVDGATGPRAQEVATERVPRLLAVTAAVARAHPDLRVEQVGDASLDRAVSGQVASDFSRAERLSLPVTLGILMLTFGALIAAGVPVLLALSAVAAAIGLSALVSQVLPVTDSLNSVILLIGMAVGVDYSLFYVRRAREERARGADRRTAIELAARTSGRAVVVSGLAVLIAMSGLLLSGNATFSSMAVGTMLVVAVAVLGSLTALPALLSLLGDRIERPRVPLIHRLRRSDGDGRLWPALMRIVLRRPLISMLLAAGALLGLAAPALHMRTGESGAESLPRSIPVVRTYDAMTTAFPQNGFAHTVVVWSADGAKLDRAALKSGVRDLVTEADAAGRFADLGQVRAVVSPDGRTATIDVPVTGDLNGTPAKKSLQELRSRLVPDLAAALPGARVAVTGPTAGAADFGATMGARLPWVIGFVLALTFVVLVFSFRSVVVALTAVLLNLLSVAAAYGLLVIVFQHGVGQGLLGFRSNGLIIDWLPLFLFVVLFGLSMDYHVFVVSRIREAHDAGLPTRVAVARGVTSSAGVVTSAAVVMVGVFSIFGTLSLLEFKQLGVGLAAAVLIDATIVRAILLPSVMMLLGRRNWWLPAALARRLPTPSH